jgi:serine/threonine-protein kinase
VARAFEAWLVAEPAAPASPALAITQVTSSTPAPTLSPTVALLHGGSARAIACLPFGYRGPSEHDYLGEVIAGELTDVLSRTRGLRVLSSSAVRSFEPTRDPREICHALGIDFVVSGSVQLSGEAMRIAVRLADATGTQISSERFDIDWGDVFEVQERAGAKIAEVLRVELTTAALRERVPREAVELYLRARRLLRAELFMEAATALDYLHRALQICPDFGPALAAYARAAVQMWFNPQRKPTHDWERIADAAVTTALRTAPDLAETHVAAARLSSHRGQLVAAIQSLRRAIEIAPTAPEAHTQLGQLECEAGRFDSGLSRLALAYDLEPTLGTYFYERARVLSFQGDHHAFHACLAEGRRLQGGLAPAHLALRHAMWWRDERLLRSAAIEAGGLPAPLPFAFEMVVRAVTAELAPGQLAAHLSALFGHVSPRFSLILRQILVEVHAYRADLGGALTWLRALDDTFFYDFAWLLYCPLLDELRIVPEVAEIMRTIKQRCDLAWAE